MFRRVDLSYGRIKMAFANLFIFCFSYISYIGFLPIFRTYLYLFCIHIALVLHTYLILSQSTICMQNKNIMDEKNTTVFLPYCIDLTLYNVIKGLRFLYFYLKSYMYVYTNCFVMYVLYNWIQTA